VTVGQLLLIAALVGVGALWGAQVLLTRRARSRVGSELGDLPAPFDQLIEGDVLLWFYSPTCAPCRAMKADAQALEAEGRLHAVDVTQNLEVARALSVWSTPTTVRVRAGRVIEVRAGAVGRAELERLAG